MRQIIYKNSMIGSYLSRRGSNFIGLSLKTICGCTYINQNFYGVKLYSYPFQNKVVFSHIIFDYIKSLKDYQSDNEIYLSNVFDTSSSIRQLQNIIINRTEPLAEDIAKLYLLYSQTSRGTLHSLLPKGKDFNLLLDKQVASLPTMTINQLHQLAVSLNQIRKFKLKIFVLFSAEVYFDCLERMKESQTLTETMRYFIITMELYGNSVVQKKGYGEFLLEFQSLVNTANPSQLVQMLHFMGLSKDMQGKVELLFSITNLLSPSFKDISFPEAAIATSSLFKMNVSFPTSSSYVFESAKKLKTFIKSKSEDISVMLCHLEMFSMVSIMKLLRKCNYYDKDLMQDLIIFLKKLNTSNCDSQFVAHTLAMLANSNFYNEEVYSIFENDILNSLQSQVSDVRFKDLSRVMWAFSHVHHQSKCEFLALVKKSLEDMSKMAELQLYASHFVDILLALCVFEIYEDSLMLLTFKEDFMNTIKASGKSHRCSCIHLLHQIYNIVFPDQLQTSPHACSSVHRTIATECAFRSAFKLIQNAIYWLDNECGTNLFEIKFLIPHINYASVIFLGDWKQTKSPSAVGDRVIMSLHPVRQRRVVIEINDSQNSVVGGANAVIGIERLKRNLLKRQGWLIAEVTERQIAAFQHDSPGLASFLINTVTNSAKP